MTSKRRPLDVAQVVTTAATMADAHGLEATTLSALARELGVQPPSLYKHVESRAALMRFLSMRAIDDLTATVGDAATGRSGPEAVHAAADAYRAYAHTRPGLYAAGTAPFIIDQDDAFRRSAAALLNVLESVLRAWDLAERAKIDAIRGMRAMLHGFVIIESTGGMALPQDVDASFRWLIDALVAGLDAERTAATS